MKHITFLAAMLMALNTYCQPDLDFRSVTPLNSSLVIFPEKSVLLDAQGNTVILVNSLLPNDGTNNFNLDIVLIKYNTDGELLWKYVFDGGNKLMDRVAEMVIDSENNIIVVGETYSKFSRGSVFEEESSIIVLKFSPAGKSLWQYSKLGEENSRNSAKSISIDSEDNIYLTGTMRMPNKNMVTIKLDKSGNEQWSSMIEGSNGQKIGYFNNEIIVLGQNVDALLVKYDVDGNTISSTDISGQVFSGKLKFDSEGDIYAIPEESYSLSKFSNSGQLLWDFTTLDFSIGHPYGFVLGFSDLSIDENMNVYISGTQNIEANYFDAITYKVDKDGNLLWENIESSEGGITAIIGSQIQSLTNGKVLVSKTHILPDNTGYQFSSELVDENGEILWDILSDTSSVFAFRSIFSNNNLYISTSEVEKEEFRNHVLTKYGVVLETLNVKEIEEKLLVYPNPSSAVVNITIPQQINGQYNLQVTNTLGKIVYQIQSKDTENISINQSEVLTPGMYVVSIFDQYRSFNSTFIVK